MMKTGLALTLLGFVSLQSFATSQDATSPPKPPPPPLCTLGDVLGQDEKDFPDIEKLAVESYMMTVEFNLPNVKQTDYYVEYYDSILRMGRIDSHQSGKNLEYIYRTDTNEAWNIKGKSCSLSSVDKTPDFFKDDQTNWRYENSSKPELTTLGPSAMFKLGLDGWKNRDKGGKRTMAYMGELPHSNVRGMKAQMWRMCQTEKAYVDFYFTAKDVSNFYDLQIVPLRVHYNSDREGEDKSPLTDQYYDILNFQPFISFGIYPFELPKGMGCKRKPGLDDLPEMPVFINKNLFFYSEVVYRQVSMKNDEDLGSYYSNLMFALNLKDKLLAYRHSPWNTTKVKKEGGEEVETTFVGSPQYTIYDMNFGYTFKVDYGTAQCSIDRRKDYVPSYVLPKNNGYLDLTNPYILFPNSEFFYLTKSHGRGLEVDVFETIIEGYLMNNETSVKKAIATHTYLRGEEKTDNLVSVSKTPTQVELRLYRENSDVEEILTFNFFGFTTKIPFVRSLFSVTRCFKNDDDYSWITLTFDTVDGSMDSILNIDFVDVEFQMMGLLNRLGNLAPYRVPRILFDLKDQLFVTVLLLEKPPMQVEFPDRVEGKKINGAAETELNTYTSCATSCLDTGGCWGFSLCGALCVIGSSSKTETVDGTNCTLYKRDNDKNPMISKDSFIRSLTEDVESGNAALEVNIGDKTVKLKATSISITDPAAGDPTFEKMGNKYSERMRIHKVASKLKNGKALGKTGFEECQRLCLNHPECETISYCLINSACVISPKYGDELKDEDIVPDQLCQLITRKYADNFDANPGFFMDVSAKKTIKVKNNEACARACLKETDFRCLSFDYCGGDDNPCRLHTSHFLKQDTRKESLDKRARCRHYTRKYSVEFKKHIDTQIIDPNLPPMTNLDVEECAKRCADFGRGSCFGFDYCKGAGATSGSCIILDSDPSLKTTKYNPACTHYLREDVDNTPPRPYTNNYAGGVGFLCFLIGGVIGAVVVFTIAYIRVNRR